MKYILLIPVIGYYIIRDIATLINHGELLRGLLIFILVFISLLFFTAWLNVAKELSKVKKLVGNQTYEWLAK